MPKLTELKVKNAKVGRHGDGGGLYLDVKPSGSRSWILRVQHMGKRQDIGLGGYPIVTLADARDKALQFRRVAKQGENAIAVRDKAKVRIPTFAEAVTEVHKEFEKGDISDKTAAAFKASLTAHAVPKIGNYRVDHIGTEQIVSALAPIWTDKPEQAKKLRVRILQVLAFAKARGWRSESPPLASEIRHGLAKQPASRHFAAMPFGQVPDFVSGQLIETTSSARLALIFTILSAARSGEVRSARWEHIDLDARLWNRPAELMKSGEAHSVTLSQAAIAIVEMAKPLSGGEGLIFPGNRAKAQLSDMTLLKVLRSAGESVTVHGFRSSFRDWAAESMLAMSDAVAESALAHKVPDAVVRAYKRTAFIDARRQLLEAWGRFVAPSISGELDNVTPIHARVSEGK